MTTVENVNIEINKKLLDELAALKAENERLKESIGRQNVHIMNHLCDKTELGDKVEQLQADKAELLEALKRCLAVGEIHFETCVLSKSVKHEILSLLSKHEAKS